MHPLFIRTVSTIHRPLVDDAQEVGTRYALCPRADIALLINGGRHFRVCSFDGINGHVEFSGDWAEFRASFGDEFIDINIVSDDGDDSGVAAAVRIDTICKVVFIENDRFATLHLSDELACSGMYGILPGRPSQVRIDLASYESMAEVLAGKR